MESQRVFILKVLLISTVLSFLIKYGGRLIPIPATTAIVLSLILLPSIIMGLFLWRRNRLTIDN